MQPAAFDPLGGDRYPASETAQVHLDGVGDIVGEIGLFSLAFSLGTFDLTIPVVVQVCATVRTKVHLAATRPEPASYLLRFVVGARLAPTTHTGTERFPSAFPGTIGKVLVGFPQAIPSLGGGEINPLLVIHYRTLFFQDTDCTD